MKENEYFIVVKYFNRKIALAKAFITFANHDKKAMYLQKKFRNVVIL